MSKVKVTSSLFVGEQRSSTRLLGVNIESRISYGGGQIFVGLEAIPDLIEALQKKYDDEKRAV